MGMGGKGSQGKVQVESLGKMNKLTNIIKTEIKDKRQRFTVIGWV